MAIDKKALARAIVPYVYEEAENQGLTTNSGSERLSIDGEIEDPSGEYDGLYVEATVKCSCDRDFPMDKDTGWRDTAEAKSLSYRVLDATVYTEDDQNIDVTEELQNALSWPDTYGPKKSLREDFEGEVDPEDPAVANVADAIAEDIFDRGNVTKGKVYSGTVEGDFGDELEGMYTVKYRVKVNQVGKSAFRSSFTPISVTMSSDEIGTVDMTDVVGEYWSMFDDDYYSDKEDDDLYEVRKKDMNLDYDEILEAILDDVCEKLETKYPDYNDSYDVEIDDEDMSAKGIVKGLFGEDSELTVKYVVNLDTVDEIQPFGISGTISRAIVIENGRSRDITSQMQDLGW